MDTIKHLNSFNKNIMKDFRGYLVFDSAPAIYLRDIEGKFIVVIGRPTYRAYSIIMLINNTQFNQFAGFTRTLFGSVEERLYDALIYILHNPQIFPKVCPILPTIIDRLDV